LKLQALVPYAPTKPVFTVKKSTHSTIGGVGMAPLWLRPSTVWFSAPKTADAGKFSKFLSPFLQLLIHEHYSKVWVRVNTDTAIQCNGRTSVVSVSRNGHLMRLGENTSVVKHTNNVKTNDIHKIRQALLRHDRGYAPRCR